ncbi:histone deacetylase family protein [Saccharospirillum salsuginis]|uniref:Acetylpolyamine amidohydrolase n=1 Tax=Saccharospirillum salsuginis TaxID=418750 RepID=A0A918NDZ5_9GAMM|nr:histone deacetylase family protein [Saccharospirillum salsuginis]GGX60931.1 acetylpolyamine amidohydrolase [Saccharospirillum salsuginis]
MKTYYSPKHRLRQPKAELHDGQWVPSFESPERMDHILEALKARGLDEPLEPGGYGMDPVLAVHDADYIEFLASVWERWVAKGHQGDAVPNIWPARTLRDIRPQAIEAQLGYYALASDTTLTEGTWQAALAAKDVTLAATEAVLAGDSSAFALCRPPGHHASSSQFGGYCFLNNAVIAAQYARDHGKQRVAVLDVDFHHGNGTQEIFYRRNDVFTTSLHGDPEHAFPFFLGRADETGAGAGEGFNLNLPLPNGTTYRAWADALETALTAIEDFGAELLVVSLGVDTFENDPISLFKLTSDDFSDYGKRLGRLGLPTVFVMEGGYAVAEIGTNTVNVLAGFNAERG